jgi:hypothetical protein
VSRDLSVLDLALVHHDVLLSVLRTPSGASSVEQTTYAAGEFFQESLSAFEMVRRGFWEARETAALERRHAEVLRRLSGFLADASLALDASDSLEEILRLVAEQARELIGAECRVASAALGPGPVSSRRRRTPRGRANGASSWTRPTCRRCSGSSTAPAVPPV